MKAQRLLRLQDYQQSSIDKIPVTILDLEPMFCITQNNVLCNTCMLVFLNRVTYKDLHVIVTHTHTYACMHIHFYLQFFLLQLKALTYFPINMQPATTVIIISAVIIMMTLLLVITIIVSFMSIRFGGTSVKYYSTSYKAYSLVRIIIVLHFYSWYMYMYTTNT